MINLSMNKNSIYYPNERCKILLTKYKEYREIDCYRIEANKKLIDIVLDNWFNHQLASSIKINGNYHQIVGIEKDNFIVVYIPLCYILK